MGGGWSTPRPGRFTPWKETRYPLYRRLGGPRRRSGRVRKISPPTGIRSPDRPARSKLLYRLSYPGPQKKDIYFPLPIALLVLNLLTSERVSCYCTCAAVMFLTSRFQPRTIQFNIIFFQFPFIYSLMFVVF